MAKRLIQALGAHGIFAVALAFGACFCSHAQQMAPIPTTGPGDLNTTVRPDTQIANQFNITGGSRPINGTNLFHSFERFSVGTDATANFVNETRLATENILSRVTGYNPSSIFGTIMTTGFEGAALYLLNPAGVMFGPGASVDVAGSFYVSTADFIELGNGARFNATDSPVGPQLAVAAPEVFGFLSANPSAIEVHNPFFNVEVNPGKTFALVGGPVDIKDTPIFAPSASVNIVSVGTGGAAQIKDANMEIAEQQPQGQITLDGAFIFAQNSGTDDTSAGHIRIIGETITLNGGTLSTEGQNTGRAGDIKVFGDEITLNNIQILAAGQGAGPAGDIIVSAEDTIAVDGAQLIATSTEERGGNITLAAREGITLDGSVGQTRLQTATNSGQAGSVSISVAEGDLAINNSLIDAEAPLENATPARINLEARNGLITLSDGTLIQSRTSASDAGDVTIAARAFTMNDGAQIEGSTEGSGQGANVRIDAAEQVSLSGEGTLITTASGDGMQTASGRGGDVAIDTPRLEIRDGAEINANANSIGRGGNITVTAPEGEVTVVGNGSAITTASLVTDENAGIAGPAGRIMIRAGRFVVSDGGEVSASTSTSGAGGDLEVIADNVLLDGEDSNVAVDSRGTASQSGRSGNLRLVANDTLEIRNQGAVSADTLGPGAGGNVAIESPDIRLNSGGTISASTRGSGRGGNIEINEINGKSGTVSLSGPSTSISSETTGEGDAGSVAIKAGRLTVRDGAAISASTSGNGKGGSVNIEATNIELLNGGAIAARSDSTSDSAESGSLSIRADDTIRIFNGSSVSVETAEADAGDIDLDVGFLLHLRDRSSITTSAAVDEEGQGQGDGGNINIDPVFTVLDGGSKIIANALEGSAGNIRIRTNFLFQSPDSEIKASNRFGVEGNVDIDSPDTDVISSALELPGSFLDVAGLLSDRCSARTAKGASSFIVSGRGGVPPGPETVLPSYSLNLSEAPKINQGATAISKDQRCNR